MADQTRSLFTIAREIRSLWPDVYFAAKPYLAAMGQLDQVTDSFGYDTGRDIVLHFLGNAKTWKGEDAARIKNELRVMIGQKPVKPRATAAKPAAKPTADKAQRRADAAKVRAAASRVMFCPYTNVILDMRRTVLVSTSSQAFVMDAGHWDRRKDDVLAGAEKSGRAVEVLDGRELFTPGGRVRA